jgi:hypothetical protein
MDQFEAFIGASARLTGFGRVDLLGGNVAESYLATVSAAAGADLVGKLCATVLDTAEGDLAATMMADDALVHRYLARLLGCLACQLRPARRHR